MVGGQDEDSCGKSGIGETPQERMRRGGSPPARGKRSLAWKSTAVSQATHTSSFVLFFVFRLE
ncbi:hypothetical protein ACEWPB_18735 [Priestia megaterium]|uniref:hypothetical protein n=1 Tax=Priestia TaxID=2800373 RepID=UPI00232C55E8|nr:hypothetical protein [Priestia sp. AB]MDC0703696.1 hypothetical protein [Priestia sp. AB]MED4208550.1 hypothetical protein [Priestia megaterium]